MDTRWAEELDRSFGDGPPPPPATTYVTAGRVAVRRRRLAAGAVSLAAVALVGGLGWVAMPGDARAGAGQVASDPTPSAQASPTTEPSVSMPPSPSPTVAESPEDVRAARPAEIPLFADGPAVTTLGDGTLIHHPGWTVTRLVLLEHRPSTTSWGVALRKDGGTEEQWVLYTDSGSTASSSMDAPGPRFARFDDWLDATWADEQRFKDVKPGQGVFVDDSIAVFTDGDVVPADGVTVLEVVLHPDEAAAYGPVGEQAAVRLRLPDGTEVFGRVDAFGTTTVDPAVLDAPTMAAFLRHLGAQGDNGEGLR